jgi:hypothetical protein
MPDSRPRKPPRDDRVRVSAVEVLARWELFGAHWRVISRRGSLLEIALLTCSGGEEVDRLTSDDPALLAFVGVRSSSEDEWPTNLPRP